LLKKKQREKREKEEKELRKREVDIWKYINKKRGRKR